MDSIEPYDYDDLKPFSRHISPATLRQIMTERGGQPCAPTGSREGSFVAAMEGTVEGYTSCSVKGGEHSPQARQGAVCAMPVWILNTKWEGKDYLFAMNGQDG